MTTLTTEPPQDQRSLYAVAVALIQQILKLCPQHGGEEGVWRAFATRQGRNQVSYFEAVQQTRHSLFHYELQQLMEFGIGEVPPDYRENFCLLAGRTLGVSALQDTVYPLLGAVGHHGVGVQAGLANIVRMYLEHYADDEYRLIPRFGPEKVVLGIKEQFPERATAYFHYYGLDAARCFRHSLELIAGGLDAVLSVMVIH